MSAGEAVLVEAVAARDDLRRLQERWGRLSGALETLSALQWDEGYGSEAFEVLGAAVEGLEGLLEGVEGWTACEDCGEVVVPVVEGVADERCPLCEALVE